MAARRRQAARAVVLDEADRVLLLRARDPFVPAKGGWWELPGGGMESGEESAAAAAREIEEETGLRGVEVGPCVWRHDARFVFAGIHFDQLEHIHVARWAGTGDTRSYRPGGQEPLEAMAFSGIGWWAAEDLVALRDGGERIIPPWLPEQLARFLAEGAPSEPIHLGELGPVF
ncbi:MAG: NUDIX domain-containing protein [Acidobacteriota bacterium]|nr:NUDIX domain-containing protein [Acidobacteriota bacterium]